MKIDKYDKKILYLLDLDSRASASKIAKEIGLSKETVNYRIKKLRKSIIKRPHAVLNIAKAGYAYFKVNLKFSKLSPTKEEHIKEFIAKETSCVNWKMLYGEYDFSFITVQKGGRSMSAFMGRILEKFPINLEKKNISRIISSYKFPNKRLWKKNADVIKLPLTRPKEQINLDYKDRKLLANLARDCMTPTIKIARRVGLGPRKALYRLKKFEKNGLIAFYSYDMVYEKMGWDSVVISIAVKNMKEIPKMVEFFNNEGCATYAYEKLGEYDFSIQLYVDDDRELRDIINRFKENFQDRLLYLNVSNIIAEYDVGYEPI